MADPRWLEVSLVVDGETAEALADLLARYVEGGVVVESGVHYTSPEDEGSSGSLVRVFGYLPLDSRIDETRRSLEESLWHLGQISPLPQPFYRTIEDQDWMAAWKKNYRPIQVGRRLLVLPAWIDQDPGERVVLRIDPGMAFGTGTHPTTQLCLEWVEALCRPGTAVIDIGCGSGILSIAALKLGAGEAVAVDIDPLSVQATRENAQANGVTRGLTAGLGSWQEVSQGQFPHRQAPLVLANILAPVLVRMLREGLAVLVEPAGHLVLSGILADQEADVLQAAASAGLKLHGRRQQSDWVALAFTAPR